jgi:hypothetical protein
MTALSDYHESGSVAIRLFLKVTSSIGLKETKFPILLRVSNTITVSTCYLSLSNSIFFRLSLGASGRNHGPVRFQDSLYS